MLDPRDVVDCTRAIFLEEIHHAIHAASSFRRGAQISDPVELVRLNARMLDDLRPGFLVEETIDDYRAQGETLRLHFVDELARAPEAILLGRRDQDETHFGGMQQRFGFM